MIQTLNISNGGRSRPEKSSLNLLPVQQSSRIDGHDEQAHRG